MKRVLVVNDNERELGAGKCYLEVHGYQVFIANSGKTALEVSKRETLDLILSDVQMPGIGGLELIERLRQNGFKGEIGISSMTKVDNSFLEQYRVFGQFSNVVDALKAYELVK
jgi:CheY-like chemotaxis protein